MTAAVRTPALGIVSDRRRLCAALELPLHDAATALIAQVRAAAAAHLAFYQLREPDLETSTLLALARQLVAAAAGGVRVFVNDRVDVAVAAGADVHLKGESLPSVRVRPWLPAGTSMSRAVHGVDEVTAAEPVDFVIAGTVSPTVSKAADTALLGLEGLAAIVAVCPVPVFAIGGITPSAWTAIAPTGAAGCAAIGAFLPARGESAESAVERAAAAFRGVD